MSKQSDKPAENIREAIESVIVAFILAFVFRAFVVEAFVIPTGSMAATLHGEHWMHTCSRCGYEYAVGANREQSGKLSLVPPNVECPNCDWRTDKLADTQTTDAGDRILVLKWPWNLAKMFPPLGPQRWDVTVFKDPKDGKTNFIKRLIGLPDEVIMILDGDVYAAPTAELPPELIEQFETMRHLKYVVGTTADSLTRETTHEEIERLRPRLCQAVAPFLRIQRKTEEAQAALWSIVYDHDHPSRKTASEPGRPTEAEPGWKPRSDAWRVEPGTLVFENRSAQPAFAIFDGKEIKDTYAYNSGMRHVALPDEPVRDVRLRAVFIPRGGDGHLRVDLGKRDDLFVATLSADGTTLLTRIAGRNPPVVVQRSTVDPFVPGRPIEIEVRNADYRVSVWINGKEIVHSTHETYAPPIAALLREAESRPMGRAPGATVSVGAVQLAGELRHVAIERDVHYRSAGIDRDPYGRLPGWGTAGNPIRLREHEYFVLGDNSPASEDGRLWSYYGDHLKLRGEAYQIGTVPEDQLIGKAFFVYWPAGYRPAFVQWGVIPNVGKMRWIH